MTEIKPAELVFIGVMLFYGFGAALNCTSPTPKSLYNALDKYLFPEKLVRPVGSFSKPLNVTVSITVVGIMGVNEKAQTLTTALWQVLEWKIDGLSWDEKECGTARVSVPREKLWVPDVVITEIMDGGRPDQTPYVYLNNSGHVYDDRPLRVISSCSLEIYTFPFDVQNCSLTFGPYLHFARDVRMIEGATSQDIFTESTEVMISNGEWELVDIQVALSTLELVDGDYSEIKYYIILKRRPVVYVVNLLIPSCFLITVDLFSFLLPPQSVDRSSFKMTLILGYTVFLLIMNDLLPVTGNSTPLINNFFTLSLSLMVVSLLETVVITNIQLSPKEYAAPRWFNVLVLRYLAVIVCTCPKKSNPYPQVTESPVNSSFTNISVTHLQGIYDDARRMTPSLSPLVSPEPALDELRKLSGELAAIRRKIDEHLQVKKSKQDWEMIATVLDRLLFGLYIIFIIISFIIILCLLTWRKNYKGQHN